MQTAAKASTDEEDFVSRVREFMGIEVDDFDVTDDEAAQQFWELLDECKRAAQGKHLALCVEEGIKHLAAKAVLQGILADYWYSPFFKGDAKVSANMVKLGFNIYNNKPPGEGINK